MNVAVIPARGGSKRIPQKNIKPFLGRPMISWSILAALKSGCFQRVVVSTDDPAIAEVAREHGAEVPFQRPEHLAGDFVATAPVIQHAIHWLQEHGQSPGFVCCIYATAPFITTEDIALGLRTLQEQDCDYVFPIAKYPFPIQRAVRVDVRGRIEMFDPKQFLARSQDLEEAWHDAGQFYWGRAAAWLAGRPMFSPAAVGIKLPSHRVQDIDDPDDWLRAEIMFRTLRESETKSTKHTRGNP